MPSTDQIERSLIKNQMWECEINGAGLKKTRKNQQSDRGEPWILLVHGTGGQCTRHKTRIG